MKTLQQITSGLSAVCLFPSYTFATAVSANVSPSILDLTVSEVAHFVDSLRTALHRPVCLSKLESPERLLSLFVYPQPAAMVLSSNVTAVYVEGFAVHRPNCVTDDRATFALLNAFMTAIGWRMRVHGPHYGTLLPAEFLYHAAVNVTLWLSYDNGKERMILPQQPDARGHFATVGRIPMIAESRFEPPLPQQSISPRSCCDTGTAASGCGQTLDLGLVASDSSGEMMECRLTVLVVPPIGLTVVADIDDILRTTEIWDPYTMFRSTFLSPLRPWLNMSSILKSWCRASEQIHFHYVSDTPDRAAGRIDLDGISRYYPSGTFDFRPWSFRDLLRSPRYRNLKQTMQMLPNRTFVLIGDTATGSTLSAYSRLAHEHPDQVQCILIRDVGRTEPANWIVPDLHQMPRHKTVLFTTPDDLKGASAHIRALAAGSATGCGPLARHDVFPARPRGFVASWFHTLDALQAHFVACLLYFEYRPARACPFDRRPGTVFRFGGGMEPAHDGR